MPSNLTPQIQKLDRANMLGSIQALSDQVSQAFFETQKLKIPKSYKSVKNLVINGMGGSALGGHIIKSLYSESLKVPLNIINTYDFPAQVNSNTLYIISSFSGNTEEPLSTLKPAQARRAKILIITAGGKLEQIMKSQKIPGYAFKAVHNPCGQPRAAVGYSVMGQLGLLNQCGLIKITEAQINSIKKILVKLKQELSPENSNNSALAIAQKFKNKIPIIVTSEFLAGNAHAFSNQINENGKNFSNWFIIPELNHHLMEGLALPQTNRQNLIFLFVNSRLYHPRVQTRFAITKEIVKKSRIPFVEYSLESQNKLYQSFELLSLGSYAAFYLAILNNLDPSPIVFVDYFKKELAKN